MGKKAKFPAVLGVQELRLLRAVAQVGHWGQCLSPDQCQQPGLSL